MSNFIYWISDVILHSLHIKRSISSTQKHKYTLTFQRSSSFPKPTHIFSALGRLIHVCASDHNKLSIPIPYRSIRTSQKDFSIQHLLFIVMAHCGCCCCCLMSHHMKRWIERIREKPQSCGISPLIIKFKWLFKTLCINILAHTHTHIYTTNGMIKCFTISLQYYVEYTTFEGEEESSEWIMNNEEDTVSTETIQRKPNCFPKLTRMCQTIIVSMLV